MTLIINNLHKVNNNLHNLLWNVDNLKHFQFAKTEIGMLLVSIIDNAKQW